MKRKKTYIALAIVFLSLSSYCMINYITVEVEKVKISLPDTFFKVSEQDVIVRYGTHRLPLAVYQDPSQQASLAINLRIDSLGYGSKIKYQSGASKGYQKDEMIEKSFYKASLAYMHTHVNFSKDTVMMINKRKCIVFEFDSQLDGKDKKGNSISSKEYNYMMYILNKNKTYIINFGCPLNRKSEFQPLAEKMMMSVKIAN